MVNSEPGASSAAAMKKEAEERSEGTVASRASSFARPGTAMRRVPRSDRPRTRAGQFRCDRASAPAQLPPSRPPRTGPRTARMSSPARSATGSSYSTGVSAAPSNFKRWKLAFARSSIRAPIRSSGVIIRCIGRLRERFIAENARCETAAPPESRRAYGWSSRSCPRPDRPPLAASPSNPLPWMVNSVPPPFDLDPQRSHARQRGMAIGAGGVVAHARGALRNRRDHGVAMRNRFIAGQRDGAGDPRGGRDADLHG